MEEYQVLLTVLDRGRGRLKFRRMWSLQVRPMKGDYMQAGKFFFEVTRVNFREDDALPEIELHNYHLNYDDTPQAIDALRTGALWEECS